MTTPTPTQTPTPTPPAAARRIFTATLVLGVPGAGKTSLLAPFAVYLWETYQKVLMLYSWDGGAIPTGVQKLMKQGLIRFWRARTRSAEGLGIETLYLATKGYWPRQINVETGETTPAVELWPPVTTLYHVSCPKTGEKLAQLPARHLVTNTYCTPCKTLHAPTELLVVEDVHRSRGFEQVGGVAFDGLTSMTGVVMEHMDHARGAGQIGGEKPAFGGIVTSGSIKLGGNNRADVGFGQSRGQQFVNNSLSIPYLVEGPVFTALSMEASDEGGLSVVGAKLPGRAATDEASAWFGNVCEVGKTLDDAGREHFTLFLRPFIDGQNRRHLLKTSASPTGLPDSLIDPIGQPWTQANLGLVFRLLDEDLRLALSEEITGAPGLAGTPTEYGEAFQMTASAGAAAPASPAVGTLPPLTAAAPVVGAPAGSSPAVVAPVAVPLAASGAPPPVMARKRPRADAVSPVTAPPAAAMAALAATDTPAQPPQDLPPQDLPVITGRLVATLAAVTVSGAGPPPPPGRPPQRLPEA